MATFSKSAILCICDSSFTMNYEPINVYSTSHKLLDFFFIGGNRNAFGFSFEEILPPRLKYVDSVPF